MFATRKLSLACLALAMVVAVQLTAAPIPGVKAGGDDGDKWLLDDAEAVIIFNFKQLFESKLMKGGYTKQLQDLMKDNEQAKEMVDKLGLDITKDIDSILISGSGTSPEDAKARVVFKGNFDVAKLSKAMKEQDQVKVVREGGVELFELEAQGQSMYGAFAGKSAFVLTESKETTAKLAKGPTESAKFNKDVKSALNRFTGKESMAMVIVINDQIKQLAAANPQVANTVNSLTTVSASVTVTDNVTIQLVGNTSDAKAAAQLEKQLTGLKAIAELGIGMAEGVPDFAKEAVENIKIDKTRDTVTVSMTITKEQIEKAAKMAGGGE
jgi:hypothetical protein